MPPLTGLPWSTLVHAAGSGRGRLIAGIFSRAAGQIGVGLALGVAAAILFTGMASDQSRGKAIFFLAAAAALMMIVGLLAALGPARRGLRVEPTEALRAE